jgi:hypothetical protein
VKKTVEQEALWEMRFWMQILGDHCRFILESLAEKEKVEIDQAKRFIHVSDKTSD